MLSSPLHDEADATAHAPVNARELPDGIELAYVDDRHRRHVVALEDAALLDFGQVKEFRKPPVYRGQRNFPGWWWLATTRSARPTRTSAKRPRSPRQLAK